MSCNIVSILNIRKDHEFVIFDLDDGSTVMYDLSTHTTIGKRGKPVKGLGSQLSGITLEAVKDKFEDQDFFNYLRRLKYINGRMACTLAAVLDRVVHNSAIEGYIRLGIACDGNIKTPVSEIPKSMLRWLADIHPLVSISIRDSLITAWKNDESIYQSILSRRDKVTREAIDKMVYNALSQSASYRHGATVFELIEKYHCNSVALTSYIVDAFMREGVDVQSALTYLRDYHRMQTAMSGDKPHYDKYPMHLLSAHHIAKRNYERLNRSVNEEAFAKTYDPALEMKVGRYTFICPKRSSEIKREAVAQQHCVASYIDNVIAGDCHIVFMRDAKMPDKSLITVEVINGRVNHATGYYNRIPTDEETNALMTYEQCLQSLAKQPVKKAS